MAQTNKIKVGGDTRNKVTLGKKFSLINKSSQQCTNQGINLSGIIIGAIGLANKILIPDQTADLILGVKKN